MIASALAAAMALALVIYALTAGADFGAGIWQLFSRDDKQRALIDHAIAPIWEANHVWLIFIIVVMFSAFPPAFALLSVQLHIPLVIMLVGIVMRGTAFVFQSYDPSPARGAKAWRAVFGIASVATPIWLGVCLGAVASSRVVASADFVSPWCHPFAFATGFFVLALFAMLAAIYLCNETDDPSLLERFRRCALWSEAIAGALAFVTLLAARQNAAKLFAALMDAWPLQVAVVLIATATMTALYRRRFGLARVAAMAQVSAVVAGLIAAQYPALIPPEQTIAGSAAPGSVLQAVGVATLAGSTILGPAFIWLFSVFKRRPNHA